MAKGKSGKEKQDNVYVQFQRDIRSEKWSSPTMVESIIAETERKKEIHADRLKRNPPAPNLSFYNPNNPLNGSGRWTKAQWQTYNDKVKADKVIAKLAAKS